jgi:hypothetical protein
MTGSGVAGEVAAAQKRKEVRARESKVWLFYHT